IARAHRVAEPAQHRRRHIRRVLQQLPDPEARPLGAAALLVARRRELARNAGYRGASGARLPRPAVHGAGEPALAGDARPRRRSAPRSRAFLRPRAFAARSRGGPRLPRESRVAPYRTALASLAAAG